MKDRKDAFEAEQTRKQEREEDKKNVALTDVAKFLADAREKLTYHALDWAITDSEALSLLDDVTAFLNEPPKLRAIVDTLEDDGLMDRWVDNIPVDALYSDVAKIAGGKTINRRSAFLRVLALRPPWKNSRKAEELLSRGLLDWAITDEDAFLAFQLVKSLPEQVRAGFYADQGGKYASRLDDQMSLSMRKGLSANFYTGGKDGGDLQSIKAQLLDDTVWTAAQMSRLRVLIQMARAADEGRWVFEQSRSRYQGSAALRELYGDSDFFKQVVQAFKLYVPKGFVRPDGTVDAKGREDYEPEEVRGHSFGSGLVSLFRAVGFLFSHTGRIQIFKESVGGEGFDFNEIQALTGGDLAGVEFAKPSEVLDADTDELTDNVVRWDLDHGVLEMRAALLAIEAVNYPLANLKIQTGAIRIHNLNLHLEYPEKDLKRDTTSLRLRIDRLDIDDMLLIRPELDDRVRAHLCVGAACRPAAQPTGGADFRPGRELRDRHLPAVSALQRVQDQRAEFGSADDRGEPYRASHGAHRGGADPARPDRDGGRDHGEGADPQQRPVRQGNLAAERGGAHPQPAQQGALSRRVGQRARPPVGPHPRIARAPGPAPAAGEPLRHL